MCIAQAVMCLARQVSVQETTPPILHTSPVWNKAALWTGDTVEERLVSLILLPTSQFAGLQHATSITVGAAACLYRKLLSALHVAQQNIKICRPHCLAEQEQEVS